MNIKIENCNNIDCAEIVVEPNMLNIKFAPNGTGKTTIAKALSIYAKGDEKAINSLMPFKYRSTSNNNIKPSVSGFVGFDNVACFNEEYINSFVFKQDELVSNSYEILFKTDQYRQIEKDIETNINEIRMVFTADAEYENFIRNLSDLGGAFKETKAGSLAKNSPGMRGLANGNKIQHIPEGLESYTPYIKSSECVDWIDWQVGGKRFMDLATVCPFCTSAIEDKKEVIEKVAVEYDKNSIKNLLAIKSVIEGLGDYFSDETRDAFDKIVQMKDGLEQEHENYIKAVKGQIDDLKNKLEKLRLLSGFDFSENDNVAAQLIKFKIDISFFSHLSSTKTTEAVGRINDTLDKMAERAGVLQGQINRLRQSTQRLVEKHKKSINDFLRSAGYRYEVDIVGENDKSQLRLKHLDHASHLSGGKEYLSFGERNAFAIVLFMYECLARKEGFVVLDDPISSFDKNKKYAILEMLFRRDANSCLMGKTVLLLTHDMDTIIDTVKILHKQFSNQTRASFLKLSKGCVVDLPITKNDITTFASICNRVIDSDANILIKLIYMRRYLEISEEKSDAYQVLSNVFHGRPDPIDSRKPDTSEDRMMDRQGYDNGVQTIQDRIPDFDYAATIELISNRDELEKLYASAQSNYEKLQIFRLIENDIDNNIVRKFINETYHVENEYICQLDPSKFDTIPEYIVDMCSSLLSEKKS